MSACLFCSSPEWVRSVCDGWRGKPTATSLSKSDCFFEQFSGRPQQSNDDITKQVLKKLQPFLQSNDLP